MQSDYNNYFFLVFQSTLGNNVSKMILRKSKNFEKPDLICRHFYHHPAEFIFLVVFFSFVQFIQWKTVAFNNTIIWLLHKLSLSVALKLIVVSNSKFSRRNSPVVRATSERKRSTEIIYILLETSVWLF